MYFQIYTGNRPFICNYYYTSIFNDIFANEYENVTLF